MTELIDKLNNEKSLTVGEWETLISGFSESDAEYAEQMSRDITVSRFGKNIYLRGIIEFTNICRNNCLYCGIRASAGEAERYRMSADDILSCCSLGYSLGYRTFVLQGGEDPARSTDFVSDVILKIKEQNPDTAVTVSIGELPREDYQKLYDSGADRYLLRHETADRHHYSLLHPETMSFDNRMRCLYDLKSIGFQTGCGMMVGSPYQTPACLAKDMKFIEEFKPEMIGIGPFRSHHNTPFRDFPDGSTKLTLFLLCLARIMLPDVLLPATTALDCGCADGRQKAVLCGANVIMPNLSPENVRKNYLLYDGKPGTEMNAEENLAEIKNMISEIGYTLISSRGDYIKRQEGETIVT